MSTNKRKIRWNADDYREALIELKSAHVEYNGKDYRLFKGLTAKNGFNLKRPEKISKSKKATIKKLMHDLSVIRSREVAIVSTRNKHRKYRAQEMSGFRSPYFNVTPLPVVPKLKSQIKWADDRPVIDYPQQRVKSMTVAVNKPAVKREMKAAFNRGEDAGDAIYSVVKRQIEKSLTIMHKEANPNDLVRFRLRTIYGDLEAGKAIGVATDLDLLLDSMAEFISAYLEKDKAGHFFIGFTIWTVSRDELLPDSFKPSKDRKGIVHATKKGRLAKRRARIKGR